MRVGELSALKPEDIQLKEKGGSIHVCRTEVHYSVTDEYGKRKNVVKVQNFAKSEAGNRHIILNSFAIQIIKRIKELNPTPVKVLIFHSDLCIKSERPMVLHFLTIKCQKPLWRIKWGTRIFQQQKNIITAIIKQMNIKRRK